VMAQYSAIYEVQETINQMTQAAYVELQRATAVLNTEQSDEDRDAEDRAQRIAMSGMDMARSTESVEATNSRLSGKHDLSKLTPAQIDRLELGFQQAITDDRRLHRLYVYLEWLYGRLAK